MCGVLSAHSPSFGPAGSIAFPPGGCGTKKTFWRKAEFQLELAQFSRVAFFCLCLLAFPMFATWWLPKLNTLVIFALF